jgi:predicted DNA-binding protein (UPF0251 family)
MIGDTIPVTYNSVVKTLAKVNQDGYSADYFLDDSANLMRFTLKVSHTLPTKTNPGESHLMKLSVEELDATGAVIRISHSWGVLRCDLAAQSMTVSQRTQAALLTALTVANTNKMLGRES